MQPATVAVLLSGDSGCTCSTIVAARTLSPASMASTASRMVAVARSRAVPTAVNRAMFCRSTARSNADTSLIFHQAL